MAKKQKKEIGADKAEEKHGITTNHEKMENGELRFRLNAEDGSSYIRTESSKKSGWQNSHFHKSIKETFIVQEGWMCMASWKHNALVLEKFDKGDIISSEPLIPHNAYLPEGAVIHTVKHGENEQDDWYAFPDLDRFTSVLSEEDILVKAVTPQTDNDFDERFPAYVNIYNNLDNLIWRIPSYFVTVAAILMAFMGNFLSKPDASFPPGLIVILFSFIGLLFLLGTYSMSRLRLHHTRMGNELKLLESEGYFHARGQTVNKKWPPPAPSIFMAVFSVLGIVFVLLAILVAISYDTFMGFLS